nr:hypothetical protein [Lysinibacter cavernae]
MRGKTIKLIAGGSTIALAVDSNNVIYPWASDNLYGQLNVPSSLSGQSIQSVAAGAWHALALTSAGKVVAWGSNAVAQATVPAALAPLTVRQIAAGYNKSLALTSTGRVYSWGEYEVDPSNASSVRKPAVNLSETYQGKVKLIDTGIFYDIAVTTSNQIVRWNAYRSEILPSAGEIVGVAAVRHNTVAITSDGRVLGWGPSRAALTIPAFVQAKTIVSINAETPFGSSPIVLALDAEGSILAWNTDTGANMTAQLTPLDSEEKRFTAAQVVGGGTGNEGSIAIQSEG